MEIIVVDNGSSDGTAELVEEQYPNVTLLRNQSNLGFAKATNLGIQASSGQYVCLINSDVVLLDGCLDNLIRYMKVPANRDVGIVGPQMLSADQAVRRSTMRLPTLTNTLCRALGIDRIPWLSLVCRGQLMSDFSHGRESEVEVLNGWFWLVRREALQDVGVLDERFFMYGEDLDWCYRFRSKRWRVLFYPEAKAVHYGGGSSSAAPERFFIEMQRADLQYWLKHHGSVALPIYYAAACLHHLLRFLGHHSATLLHSRRRALHNAKAQRSWAALTYLLRNAV
jgi:GT2 family glycosyltransferase